MFHAAEARGHALLGDARSAQTASGRAVTALEQADPSAGDDPVWIAHFDEAYLADELAHCHRDLGQAEAAARCAQESLDGHPESRARRRAIGYVLLATAQVQQREVEQACNTGLKAVELLETLRSNRGAEYLDDFQQRLEPFRDEPVVMEFGERLELQVAA
ncbi:Transcriptional regulator OS=Streptomyces alboniger OX=132473 GN=CP975_15310 PE=4 SV=1 [Streptomyces alboniger]